MKIRTAFSLMVLLLQTFPTHAVETNRGTDIMGPPTLNHPSYPNSGQLRHLPEDVPLAPVVPDRAPELQEEEQRAIRPGPYRNEHRYYPESGPQGPEAEEAVKSGKLDLSKEEIRKKQKGK